MILTFNNNVNASVGISSTVGFPPSIQELAFNNAVDTDLTITGSVSITNSSNANISVNLTSNGVLYKGESKTYADSMTWEYANGSEFTIKNNSIEYVRATSEAQDLNTDVYIFDILIANKYGTDSEQAKVQTTIPKATIVAFTADNISDTEKKISGVLKFELPVIANNPTIKIDVSVNGIVYQGGIYSLSSPAISYEYANGANLVFDVTGNTFVYTRSSDDYTNADADVYSFECSISVNGEVVSRTLTVKSMAGQRFYDYEPAYPVSIQPGSVETQRTAWGKYVEENKRLYRLLNENLNYYENIAVEIKKSMEDLKSWAEGKFSEYDKRINDSIAAINNRLNTELANLKNSIQVQAFAWANPGTVPTPSGYSTHNCIYLVLRGQYGSYGVQNLLFYSSMGHPEYVEGYTKGAHNSVFVICSHSWWFA